MSFRQDKLVLLIETGTSSQVRRTAAKQLADLTVKSFRASRPSGKEEVPADVKPDGKEDVKPDTNGNGSDTISDGPLTLSGGANEEDSWAEVLDTSAKIIPLLRAKVSDTRTAAAHALGLLAEYLPSYTQPTASYASSSRSLDVPVLLRTGQPLLASAGREYIAKPTGGDRAKRRKAMMGTLGLGDAVGWGDDVDKVIGDGDDDDNTQDTQSNGQQKNGAAELPPKDIFEGLSARQIAMVKRKKGNMAEEANKLRKLNQAASGATSPTVSETPTPAGSPRRNGSALPPDLGHGAVVIDSGAKARAGVAANGGAVEPTVDAQGNAVELPVKPTIKRADGQHPWHAILDEISPYLADSAWQARHGAAAATMEVIRTGVITDEAYLLDTARELLNLLALDRFGDFLGDTVMAPVRETAAQALGVTLKYLSHTAVSEIHSSLITMVTQAWAKRGMQADGREKWERFSWELRHAGLLGLKYQVAVRSDLLLASIKAEETMEIDTKPDVKATQRTMLQDVVDAVIASLRDQDDDVRSVAASALLPIVDQLATSLPRDQMSAVLDTLWDCLAEGGDELGSSTGAIMDLLGAMFSKPEIVSLIGDASRASGEYSRLTLITRIFAFVRHPITTVRLAVAKVLLDFGRNAASLGNDWLNEDLLKLHFQNLVLEEREDIRMASFHALDLVLSLIKGTSATEMLVDLVPQWYSMVMTPVGAPLDQDLFKRVGKPSGHNIDKPMIAGDLSLVSSETMLTTRIHAAEVLARLRSSALQKTPDVGLLRDYLRSGSAHQVSMASVIIQKWATHADELGSSTTQSLADANPDARLLADILVQRMEAPLPQTYSEMTTILSRIAGECQALLSAFAVEGKVAKDKIPKLPSRVDPLSASSDVFSLDTAQKALSVHFDTLSALMSKAAAKTILPSLQDRQRKVMASLGFYSVMKERYDIQVAAAVAGALIALRTMPPKFGPVVKAVMESVKREESEVLQTRSAVSVASFVAFTSTALWTAKANPSHKVVSNLFAFLCSDTAINPVFTTATEGIITLQEEKALAATAQKKGAGKDAPEETEAQIAMRIARRGALEAFKALSSQFGLSLFDAVSKAWDGLTSALLSAYGADNGVDLEAAHTRLTEATLGQDVIDCLTSLRYISPYLAAGLQKKLLELFPPIICSLQSPYTLVRSTAAKCLAALCDVLTEEAMKEVVDRVVPLIGDARRVAARQGAVEAVHHIIKVLDIKALPYVLFLIVPILGRMSDPDEPTRLLSTSTFAALIKMVPLEAGIPDPPGFSADLLLKRDEERKFLMQLLDGSKAEQYQIPIPIKADLRQYQKDGVSWLAFLAKYQLHGILCDDMGLGKSLQSICIVGSKHFERAEKHKVTGSVDSAHLPSLIVCPPTLTGHWFFEIQKFTDSLRPVQYVGSSAERAMLRPSLTKYDIVIASYETIRADIESLGQIDWLYCVLDEGHIIKNAKTKLAAAIKQLKAQHRLLLSGTPIQNNVLELWSLFDFLMPGFLGTERVFNERFSKPILADREGKATPKEREAAASALESLHKQVLPFLLRRLKEDVLNDLPPKIIQDYYCELSPVQKYLYDEFSKSQAAEEAGEAVSTDTPGKGHVFQSLQYLRKLCNHPVLALDGDTSRFELVAKASGGPGPKDLSHAPKLEALRQLLLDCGIGLPSTEKIASELPQHRVLIFCQLRPMLDIIERDLFASHLPTLKYMRMDGSTDPRKRHAVVQTFNADPRIDVLLLTTSVGGLGLNLTGADTVIFVDHDWNPMKDLQAMDRAHRLGQKKVVNVYRLITRGTLEEKIMGLQRFKLNIASSVVTKDNKGLGSMNTGEVLDLFKVSAESETVKTQKQSSGPVSVSRILEGLEDLPPDDEYAELSLSNFMSKV